MSLAAAAKSGPDRDGLALADEPSYSWAELDPLLNRATNAFLALDYRDRPRRIAIFARNSAETMIAYLASLQAGVSSAPVSFHLTEAEASYILEDSAATALFVGPENCDAGLAAARTAGVATVIGWRCPDREGLLKWEDMLAAASDAEPPHDLPMMVHLHYTSGTTGRPKAAETPPVYLPRVGTVGALAAALRERALPSPTLVAGPLYHTGPLGSVRNMLGGVAAVVMESFDPERVLQTIERYRTANAVMVPTHFQRLLSLPNDVRQRYDHSSMIRLAHTGSACPVSVKQQMIDWFGPVLFDAYGATEAGTTNMITSEEWLRKPGSVGKAIAPFETVILDEDDNELPANQVGRLYFRDTTGRGIVYHNDPVKTAEAHVAPGVFTLGEMGYVDEDGYVFITDRVSDMIVSGGVNIYPAEAENVLLRHPKVEDVAVIGVPNDDMGEEAKALVIPHNRSDPPSADELNRFCRESLASYKCPRSYDIVEDIGRNAMGKVNKRQLRQKFWPTGRTIGG
jgi:long-chain acyl-CoA synthetase